MRTPSSSARPLTLCEVLLEEAAAITDGIIQTRTESHPGTEAELQSLRENRAEIQKTIDQIRSAPRASEEADSSQERKDVFDLLHKLDRAALCFSGGGIRSATFGLGILQGLAQHSKMDDGILRSLDFISTVSGGGYLGGWLTRWREEVKSEGGMSEVIRKLSETPADRLTPEPKPISYLRAYSNYLDPKLGATSGDTWTLVATVVRNLILNWLILLPLLAITLLIPRIVLELIALAAPHRPYGAGVLYPVLGAAFIAGTYAVRFVTLNLPAFGNKGEDERAYLRKGLLPFVLTAVFLAAYWYLSDDRTYPLAQLLHFCLFGFAVHAFGTLLAVIQVRPVWHEYEVPQNKLQAIWRAMRPIKGVVASGISGAVGGLVAYYVLRGVAKIHVPAVYETETFLVVSIPLVLVIFSVVAILLVGLTSKFTLDEDREWWARSGAFILLAVGGWLVATGLVLFGARGLALINGKIQAAIAAAGGLTSFVVSKIGASSGCSSGRDNKPTPGLRIALGAHDKWLPAVGLVGLAMVAVVVCATNERLIEAFAPDSGINRLLAFLIALTAEAGFVLLISWYVNVNKFSLHAMYRNRLVRAYLGASRKRNENAFTKFDPDDNIPIAAVNYSANGCIERPLHVVNMALNLVRGQNLAWQERKAASFTVTALHAGSLGMNYQPTKDYGGIRGGLKLGTAIAISGAAASPNMGYHSSPILSAIMTFFNVRLGWWLANPGEPGRKFWRDNAPRNAIRPLIDEALGRTTNVNEWVYLSDGGHFENLGLYEMVLRRCRTIIVIDSGADPDYKFEDLGNAVRKIRIDLGISITFEKDTMPTKTNGCHCAVGKIEYKCVDGKINGKDDAPDGTLIYIKPVLCGEEPADVAQYAASDSRFPQQPTSDQWFSESQFESYRRLGLHTIEHMVEELKASRHQDAGISLQDLITRAAQQMHPSTKMRIRLDVGA